MSLTYTTYVTALSTLLIIESSETNFVAILPDIIDYAEQRIYRELDLAATVVRDSSASLTANNRTFTLPSAQGRFVVVNGINVVTPVGSTPANGTRTPLIPCSRDAIDLFWPSETAASASTVPAKFAMITDQIVIVGPPPGAGYNVEVVGTIRPAALSVSNTTTVLSTYFPDLFFAASMVFASGYTKNFGSQSDDPKMAMSWEAQYQTLKSSAAIEEARKKFQGSQWSSMAPSPISEPART